MGGAVLMWVDAAKSLPYAFLYTPSSMVNEVVLDMI
jgi:hypothetical protein